MKKVLPILAAVSFGPGLAHSQIIQFDLIGTAGAGLLFGNEPSVASGGSGGEIGGGITYDSATSILDLSNVGWGSSQGFDDLTSSVTGAHMHFTSNANGNNGSADFTQTGGVVFGLTASSTATTGGTFSNLVDLDNLPDPAQKKADLLNGKWYINIHTSNNGGGEIRGFLVAVPEPSTSLFGALAFGALALRRRR
ncbi:MAG: CHRD domain-containing protein [Verrucomicrobiaceae bacterium]